MARLAAPTFGNRTSGPRAQVGWGNRALKVVRLGEVGYARALELQEDLVERRRRGAVGDSLLLLAHPHVVTIGSSGGDRHLLLSRRELGERGIGLYETGRGGDVTYHGPGQIVGYPILDLKPDRRDLHAYLRSLETVLIEALASFGVRAGRDETATGVWVDGAKVAAIGIRVSSGWITSHGFALNVGTDLSYFGAIVPCGLHGRPVTSVERILGREVAHAELHSAIARAMVREFGYGGVEIVSGRPQSSGEASLGGANSR